MIDKAKDIDSKAIGLILIMVLLTQSMDVYLILIVVIIGYQLIIKSVGGRKIRIVLHG